jgi:hypothetical protein
VIPFNAVPEDGFKTQHLTCIKEFYESRTHAGEDIYNPDFFYKAFNTCEPRVHPQDPEIYGGWVATSYSERLSMAHEEMLLELSPMPAVEPGRISRELSNTIARFCILTISVILIAGAMYWLACCFLHQMRKMGMSRARFVDGLRKDRRAASDKFEDRHIRWADEE